MCSPFVSWAKSVPLPPSPQEPVSGGVPSSYQEEFLGVGYACPVDKDIALSPDNLIWPTWNLALGTVVATVPAPRLQEQQGFRRPERTQVCLALRRPLYTDVLVKLPTWAMRESKQS